MLSCEQNAFAILTKIAWQFVQDFVVEFIDIDVNINRGNECAMETGSASPRTCIRKRKSTMTMSRRCYNPEILSISGAVLYNTLHECRELRVSHA
jgi:hypothetical protein